MAPAISQPAVKRAYRSPTRARRARETREKILVAASLEFVRSGYAATTMRSVANAAGLSVPTVELVFGTKPQLLQAAISFAIRGDAEPLPMLERDWALRAKAASRVSDFLSIVEHVFVDSAHRSAGLVVAAFEAARMDESMLALAERLRAQRAETAAWIVDGLTERASLRPEITRARAIDTVWLLMDPGVFCLLTQHRAWTPHQFGKWFTDSVVRLLLADDEPAAEMSKRRPRSPSPRSTITRKPRRESS